jgi:hypothetical protein
MSEIKVMSTTYPETKLQENEWMRMFKVSSRIKEMYRPTQRVEYISSQYDYTNIKDIIKKLKL